MVHDDDGWFTDGNKQPCDKPQSMTANTDTEAVRCTEPRRARREMTLHEDNHGAVGGIWLRFLLLLQNISCLEMPMSSSNALRNTTEHQHTEDSSIQSNSGQELHGKRKISKRYSSNELDSVESKIFPQDAYIQIPLSVMSGNKSISIKNQFSSHEDKSPSSPVEGQCVKSNYKLIEGFPSCADKRKRKSYVMSYNRVTKNADWVYEILNKSTLEKRCKENMSFGKNTLEKNYQQGHLAAAANHTWCQEAYLATYLLTNMIPQLSDSNQGVWKTLEKYCRDLAKDGGNVHVYSGPLYLCKKTNSEETNSDYIRDPNPRYSENKAVPSHLFKVIIVETKRSVGEPKCYMIPNEQPEYNIKKLKATNFPEALDLEEFLVDHIETIEIWSGLKFKIDKPQHNMREQTKTIIWKGEDKEGELCEAKIEVKIQICILQ